MSLAVARALSARGRGVYDFCRSRQPDDSGGGSWATDCSGFVLWAYQKPLVVKGFNHGPWASVSDDVTTDSMVEDALHKREMFEPVGTSLPQPGDLLVYPGAWHNGKRILIGHVSIVSGVPAQWNGNYSSLRVVQCHGPNGTPMAVETDGSIWAHHDANFPKYKSLILRVK